MARLKWKLTSMNLRSSWRYWRFLWSRRDWTILYWMTWRRRLEKARIRSSRLIDIVLMLSRFLGLHLPLLFFQLLSFFGFSLLFLNSLVLCLLPLFFSLGKVPVVPHFLLILLFLTLMAVLHGDTSCLEGPQHGFYQSVDLSSPFLPSDPTTASQCFLVSNLRRPINR